MVRKREKEFVKGVSLDDKFAHVNATLKHFNRRLRESAKVVIGIVPSSPVFNFVYAPDSEGVILRAIFPSRGRILSGCMFIEDHGENNKSTILEAKVDSARGNFSRLFEVKKIPLVLELNEEISGGDRLTISVKDGVGVKGIWMALLYEVDPGTMTKQEFMIEQFRSLTEENEDINEE